jgi:hypothetical protein
MARLQPQHIVNLNSTGGRCKILLEKEHPAPPALVEVEMIFE